MHSDRLLALKGLLAVGGGGYAALQALCSSVWQPLRQVSCDFIVLASCRPLCSTGSVLHAMLFGDMGQQKPGICPLHGIAGIAPRRPWVPIIVHAT